MVRAGSGHPTSTLYNYFRSRSDLTAYIVARVFDPHENVNDEIAASDRSVIEKLHALAKEHLRFYDENCDMLSVLYEGSSTKSVTTIKEVEDARERSMQRIMRIMEEGISKKVLRNTSPVDLTLSFSGVLSAVWGYRLIYNSDKSIEDDAERIMNIFMKGAQPQ